MIDEMIGADLFDIAVEKPTGKLLAWDLNMRHGKRTLSVFSLVQGGAHQIAWRQYPEGERAVLSHDFASFGFKIGVYDSLGGPFVWMISQEEVVVWDESTEALTARNRTISFGTGQTLRVEDIEAFVAYAEPDYVDRGVKARLKSGGSVTVLYHLSMGASGNPTYNRNDLLMDTEWCNAIARALADWAKVPYHDEI